MYLRTLVAKSHLEVRIGLGLESELLHVAKSEGQWHSEPLFFVSIVVALSVLNPNPQP